MKNRYWIIIAFALTCLVQIFAIGKVIYAKEKIISKGTVYKFDLQPVDPLDLFRGKYIDLRFSSTIVEIPAEDMEEGDYRQRQIVFAELDTDSLGYARISKVQLSRPENASDYLEVEGRKYDNKWHLSFPFDRFYMEESKAFPAEKLYQRSVRERNEMDAYALIAVRNGQAVIKDVEIDGVPIHEAVRREMEKEAQKKR